MSDIIKNETIIGKLVESLTETYDIDGSILPLEYHNIN